MAPQFRPTRVAIICREGTKESWSALTSVRLGDSMSDKAKIVKDLERQVNEWQKVFPHHTISLVELEEPGYGVISSVLSPINVETMKFIGANPLTYELARMANQDSYERNRDQIMNGDKDVAAET